ncbi:MAG: TetR family transcriptional regulator [Tepidiformaceae bacterium]
MRQEERRARTRAALIEAAATYFARLGYESTSLDELAASAGFSKGAVYAHFPTKLDLFHAVIDGALESAEDGVEAAALVVAENGDPMAAARRYAASQDGWLHPGLMSELWRMATREESVRTRLEQYRDLRLILLSQAAVDAGLSPDAALTRARLVGRLIDAEILELHLGLAAGDRTTSRA